VNNQRHCFQFSVRTAAKGEERYGKLTYRLWSRGPCDDGGWRFGRHLLGRFASTSITSATFSDAPASKPSARNPSLLIDSVVFSGKGRWNGNPGYTFEVKATDAGEPGAGRDTFTLTITSPGGKVVTSLGGLISGGNIQSKRPR
jgi:hypothetical protein